MADGAAGPAPGWVSGPLGILLIAEADDLPTESC